MELSRSAVSWILRVRRVKTEGGFLEVSEFWRDPGTFSFSGPKAAYAISLKLIKSAFVRNGAMIIWSAGVSGCFAGRIRMVCSWTWFLPHGRRSISMVSTFSKPCLRYNDRPSGVDST